VLSFETTYPLHLACSLPLLCPVLVIGGSHEGNKGNEINQINETNEIRAFQPCVKDYV